MQDTTAEPKTDQAAPPKRARGIDASGRHEIELVRECVACDGTGNVEADDPNRPPGGTVATTKCTACDGAGQTKRKFLFRIPQIDDIWEVLGRLPLDVELAQQVSKNLRDGRAGGDVDVQKAVPAMQQTIAFCSKLLCQVSIAPKIIEDSPAVLDPGVQPVREMSARDRFLLGNQLLDLSGFTSLTDGSLGNASETARG